MSEPRLVVVLSPHQNAFFAEIAEVLVDEVTRLGVEATVTRDAGSHNVGPDDVFVLLPPHEYTVLEGAAFVDDPVVAARTIGISAEQPHQSFFSRNAEVGARLGAVLDFSPLAVDAYRRLGIEAKYLRFGYTRRWDRYRPGHIGDGPPRVLYLGNKRPRRLLRLAEAATTLARPETRLLISDNDNPNLATGPTFVVGDDKRDLLTRTRLLVNIHQGDEPYFEWLRFAEAAHCGTPVLSERSDHTDPFVPGVHFAEFDDHELAAAIASLVDDDHRLVELAAAAYAELQRHPLAAAAELLVEVARERLASPPPEMLPARTLAAPFGSELRVAPPIAAGQLRRRPRIGRPRRPAQLTVLSDDATGLGVGPGGGFGFDSVRVIVPGDLDARTARRLPDGLVLIAPAGTRPYEGAFGELVERARRGAGADVAHWGAIVDGLDADGEPTLEGIWPWEAWRLGRGQHLGRVVVVPTDVVRAAAEWFDHEPLRRHPYALVQWWVATHGGLGEHLPFPIAHLDGVAVDPAQPIPGEVVERLAQVAPEVAPPWEPSGS